MVQSSRFTCVQRFRSHCKVSGDTHHRRVETEKPSGPIPCPVAEKSLRRDCCRRGSGRPPCTVDHTGFAVQLDGTSHPHYAIYDHCLWPRPGEHLHDFLPRHPKPPQRSLRSTSSRITGLFLARLLSPSLAYPHMTQTAPTSPTSKCPPPGHPPDCAQLQHAPRLTLAPHLPTSRTRHACPLHGPPYRWPSPRIRD